MTERPILFSGEMVRAILDRRKTQTRRVIKPQPNCVHDNHRWVWLKEKWVDCPYGQPGDRLWVRETWKSKYIGDCSDGKTTFAITYKSDNSEEHFNLSEDQYWKYRNILDKPDVWHPSIFMPRWASRILREIVNIRVERIQDISEADIIAEGCPNEYLLGRSWYKPLWESINAKRGFGWDTNPWVWVIEFKRIDNG